MTEVYDLTEAEEVEQATHEHDLIVHQTSGPQLDDHMTEAGQCRTCKAWIVRTAWLARDGFEDSPMTADQIARFQAMEDRYRTGDR